jgi:hypothetical protein
MKKSVLVFLVFIGLITLIWLIWQKSPSKTTPAADTPLDLPINTIPLDERPFITLSPDSTGRSLDISLSGAPTEGELEYEMIYNASGKQEGALGSIFLGSEKQPIVKSILLGSKSGGGKITYHEGVTGGSITVTYGETRLKESWNYLHYDPSDPTISSTDARLSIELSKAALKKDSVIITMKTFGYPKLNGKVIVGPYGYFTQTEVKDSVKVSLKLPAGEHINPTIYELGGTTWKKLVTKLDGDTVSAPATGSVFLVTAQ